MRLYRYTGINPAGFRINGELLAASTDEASAALSQINVVLLRCRAVSTQDAVQSGVAVLTRWLQQALPAESAWPVGLRAGRPATRVALSTRQLLQFTLDVASLLEAGLPLVTALQQVQYASTNAKVNLFAARLQQYISEGFSFSTALRRFGNTVPAGYASVVEVAENRGALGPELIRLAQQMESRLLFQQRIKRAIAYPLLVLSLLGLLVAFLVSTVIPSLGDFMQELDQVMPWHTQALINLCDWLRFQAPMLLLVLVMVVVAVLLARRVHRGFRLWSDGYWLRVPVVGPLMLDWHTVQFARDLASLSSAGIDLLSALKLVEVVSFNHHLWANTRVIRLQVEEGIALQGAMRSSGLFATDCLQLVRLAEASGHYADALHQVEKLATRRLTTRIERIERSVGPLMMLVTGLLILWIIVSVIEPVYTSAINAGGLL